MQARFIAEFPRHEQKKGKPSTCGEALDSNRRNGVIVPSAGRVFYKIRLKKISVPLPSRDAWLVLGEAI